MSGEQLVVMEKRANGVALIRMNRPDKRNAMNREAQDLLLKAFEECRTDTRAVILTGTGSAFCSGVDLKEQRKRQMAGPVQREFSTGSHRWLEVNTAIRHHPAIFVAAVNGFALGGGVTLINACDLAIAADEAQIGTPEVGFGLYPSLAGPSTQLRVLPKHAAWLVLTAQRIDGRTAERWGLVNRSVPLVELMTVAEEVASHIAQFDPVTLDWSKKALREIPEHIGDWTRALEFGGLIGAKIRANTTAIKEGLDRFAAGEKNPGQGA